MKSKISLILLILLGVVYTPEPFLFNKLIIGSVGVIGIISLILILKNRINNKLINLGHYGIWITIIITLLILPPGFILGGGGHPGSGGLLFDLVWGGGKLSTVLVLISCVLFFMGYLKGRKLQ